MISVKQYQIGNESLPVMIINLKKRSIVSVPTQIGCAIGCRFCISSLTPFSRNLKSNEIIELVDFGMSHATNPSALVSFTGEGEPFLNLKELNQAMNVLQSKENIDAFRLCTSGVKPDLIGKVEQTSKPLHLQFSMHSTDDVKRKHLIPKTKPLGQILQSINDHQDKYAEIAVNYVLMKDFNDTDSDLRALQRMINKEWIVKLNPLLDENGEFTKSTQSQHFYDGLKLNGHSVEQYNKVGSTIKNNFYTKLAHEKHNAIALG